MLFVGEDGIPNRSAAEVGTVLAKIGSDGVCYVLSAIDGKLFNPLTMKHLANTLDKERGMSTFKLRRCSQKCYQYYATFLRTKNNINLVIAEREVAGG